MSKFVFYLKLEPFLRSWLLSSFCEPVAFPSQSIANATIRHFIQKRPADMPVQLKKEGEVAICIPDSRYHRPDTYNYMGKYGMSALKEHINDLFNLDLWNSLADVATNNLHVMNAIYQYCEEHNIDINYANTIRQRFYRMRCSYEKNGVCLKKKTKKHSH